MSSKPEIKKGRCLLRRRKTEAVLLGMSSQIAFAYPAVLRLSLFLYRLVQ